MVNLSNSIDVPDFTSGRWKTNEPGMDIALKKGGTTGLLYKEDRNGNALRKEIDN